MTTQLRLLSPTALRLESDPTLAPFLKWPGGKSQELRAIAAAAPDLTGRFLDPFVGGGSILLAVPLEVEAWANDAAPDLVALYQAAAADGWGFRTSLAGLARAWDMLSAADMTYRDLAGKFLSGETTGLVSVSTLDALESVIVSGGPGLGATFRGRLDHDLPVKFSRMRTIQRTVGRELSDRDLLANIEGAVRAAFYMAVRARYNQVRLSGTWTDLRAADFFFLREFAYAAMFRFNARGEFNVPYGGVTYNRKSLSDKLDLLLSSPMLARLRNTTWRCVDFEPFLEEAAPTASDFVFIDPPYDSDFSEYDNLAFDRRDQERLAGVLAAVPAKVMVVIKDTPVVRRLYTADRWRVAEAGKTYMWTIKSRNDRAAIHLTITNY